jgi:hypothetical protein
LRLNGTIPKVERTFDTVSDVIHMPPIPAWLLFMTRLALCLWALAACPHNAAAQALKIAVAVSQTGFGETAGQPALNAARLAIDEANAAGGLPVTLLTYDDMSTADGARAAARRAVADGALAVVGPVISVLSLAAGPIYAQVRPSSPSRRPRTAIR